MLKEVIFDVPDDIAAGLFRGDLTRIGGVIRRVSGSGPGQIVSMLREVSNTPLPNKALSLGGFPAGSLGLVGSVTSILNLGATVGFGIAILNRLGKIDKKIDHLQWTVEIGFHTTLGMLQKVIDFQEADIISNAKSAAQLAWSAQLLEPGSHQRSMRIENALSQVMAASEKSNIITIDRMTQTARGLASQPSHAKRLRVDEDLICNLKRFRMSCSLVSLKCGVMAESGDMEGAATICKEDSRKLKEVFDAVALAFLRGDPRLTEAKQKSKTRVADSSLLSLLSGTPLPQKPSTPSYQALLSATWMREISPERVGLWAKRFDPEMENGLPDVIQALRGLPKSKCQEALNSDFLELATDPSSKYGKVLESVDLIDNVYEDVQRLIGNSYEYEYACTNNLSIDSYRSFMRVDDAPKNKNLALLVPVPDSGKVDKAKKATAKSRKIS